MHFLPQAISNLTALMLIGLALAFPFIVYSEIRDRRRARRIAQIARLREALDAEIRSAFAALDENAALAAEQPERDALHRLNARIHANLGIQLTAAQ